MKMATMAETREEQEEKAIRGRWQKAKGGGKGREEPPQDNRREKKGEYFVFPSV